MGLKFYELHQDWRKILQEALSESGIVGEHFTGKLEINYNEGGIVDCYKNQRLTKYSAEKHKIWPSSTETSKK